MNILNNQELQNLLGSFTTSLPSDKENITIKDSKGNIHQINKDEYNKLTSRQYPQEGPISPEAIIPIEGAQTPYQIQQQLKQEGKEILQTV